MNPHAIPDKISEMLNQLHFVDEGIEEVLDQITDDDTRTTLLEAQRETQRQISTLATILGIDGVNEPAYIPIVPQSALSPWRAAWQRAWPEHEGMSSRYDHQVVLKMDNQWLVVSNITNIREPGDLEDVFSVGVATISTHGTSSLAMNKALMTESQVFSYFRNHGYGVSDESPWRATLADAERSWSGAWAANDEWNATHEEIWRCNQIQAEAPCCDGTKTTLLCVNRTSAGLFEPGFYQNGGVRVVRDAISEAEIKDWYDAFTHKVDFSYDLPWEIATLK